MVRLPAALLAVLLAALPLKHPDQNQDEEVFAAGERRKEHPRRAPDKEKAVNGMKETGKVAADACGDANPIGPGVPSGGALCEFIKFGEFA